MISTTAALRYRPWKFWFLSDSQQGQMLSCLGAATDSLDVPKQHCEPPLHRAMPHICMNWIYSTCMCSYKAQYASLVHICCLATSNKYITIMCIEHYRKRERKREKRERKRKKQEREKRKEEKETRERKEKGGERNKREKRAVERKTDTNMYNTINNMYAQATYSQGSSRSSSPPPCR